MINTDEHPLRRAERDITRCIVCSHRYMSDDVRLNVYQDDTWIGTIHDVCYSDLLRISIPVLAVN